MSLSVFRKPHKITEHKSKVKFSKYDYHSIRIGAGDILNKCDEGLTSSN